MIIPITDLAPRCYPTVAVVNNTDIAILGGYDSSEYLSDVVIFNMESGFCRQVIYDPALEFYAFGN